MHGLFIILIIINYIIFRNYVLRKSEVSNCLYTPLMLLDTLILKVKIYDADHLNFVNLNCFKEWVYLGECHFNSDLQKVFPFIKLTSIFIRIVYLKKNGCSEGLILLFKT